ncbi:MAG: EAL domain-containing protein [Acidimicrobiia bacterium]
MPYTHHFARQPIVDRSGRVLAYEVLFRADGGASDAVFLDGVAATQDVLTALDHQGPDLFGGVPAFVNLPRSLILGGALGWCDPRRVGAEVLEDVVADPEVIDALADLRRRGFTIALDDFRPDRARMPLVEHADIVKIDVQDLGFDLTRLVRELHRSGALVLAEKVETDTELEACLDAGFDLFQGYAVGVPHTVAVSPDSPAVVTRAPKWLNTRISRRGMVEPLRT